MVYSAQFQRRARRFSVVAILILIPIYLTGCGSDDNGTGPDDKDPIPLLQDWYTYNLVAEYPHDQYAFSEGLIFADGYLYEGTGVDANSSLREVDLATGNVIRSRALPAHPDSGTYFGEGITIIGNHIFQQTWKDSLGFIFDKDTFDSLGMFEYERDAWGLADDGQRLIVSDGSAWIFFYDAVDYRLLDSIHVRDSAGPVRRLNELEYIDGQIWANIWFSSLIARINPDNGDVVAYVELAGLLDSTYYFGEGTTQRTLNGIAWDSTGNRLFVTGKYWPSLFEIQVIKRP